MELGADDLEFWILEMILNIEMILGWFRGRDAG